MCDEIQVLTETFFISNESCAFTFDGNILQWRDNTVPVRNIIIVDYVHEGNCCKNKLFIFKQEAHSCMGHDSMVIRYAQYQRKNKLRMCSVKFQGEPYQISQWMNVLRAALNDIRSDRPKYYLVFINPFSGRQNGMEIYERKVKPIFQLAQIEACVIKTKCVEDFEKVICSGVECYDAILAVGGDGTVSEIVNCLIRNQMNNSSPEDDVCTMPQIKIPIAIIPCGSTDCVAFTINGTRDIETCSLYAILGNRLRYDVCRAISETGCTRYFVSVFTYGFLSDLIRESEKFRWMGPMRYNYAGLLTLLKSREYYAQLKMIGQQCKRPSSCHSIKVKKGRSRCISMCVIPFVPTIEPGSEYLTSRVSCKNMKKNYKIPKCEGNELVRCSPDKIDMEDDEISIEELPTDDDDKKYGAEKLEKFECEDLSPKIDEDEAEAPKEDEEPKNEDPENTEENEDCERDYHSDYETEPSQNDVPQPSDECEIEEPTEKEDDNSSEKSESKRGSMAVVECDETSKENADDSGNEQGSATSVVAEVPPPSDGVVLDSTENQGESCEDLRNKLVVPVRSPSSERSPESTWDQLCIKGKYFLIACANICCASELTPNGIVPQNEPGDGQMNVLLFQPSSICDLYKIYTRVTSKDKDICLSDLPFVTVYKTKDVRIEIMQKNCEKHVANLDGELFPGSVVDIKLFEGVIQFLAKFPETPCY